MRNISRVALFIIVPILGIMALSYSSYYSWTDYQLSKSPNETLSSLIEEANKAIPINKDPYAASTYRPGESLYLPVLAIQESNFKKAKKLLEPLAEENNPDAIFWLALATYKMIDSSTSSQGHNPKKEVANLFQKSAELGNPYAALMLDNSNCLYGMSAYCELKWGASAKKILKERAEKGDLKARYALFINSPRSFSSFDHIVDLAKQGITENYYKPLLTLVDLYRKRLPISPFEGGHVSLTKIESLNLSKLVGIALNNNDMDAIVYMHANKSLYTEFYYEKTFKRIIPYLSYRFYKWSNDYYSELNKRVKGRKYAIKGYAHARKFDIIHSGTKKRYEHIVVGDLNDKLKYGRYGYGTVTKKERVKANVLAKKYMKSASPIIFINEVNPINSIFHAYLQRDHLYEFLGLSPE